MSLYMGLKDDITKLVLDGTYKSGSGLPTEQELCERYGLSRVTVRKALEELKKDGMISSVQGQGTAVSSRKGGYPSSLELIALVAPTHNPFFASFMAHFEKVAEENGSLVLFKQDFQGRAFASEDLFYRFIKKDIRNVVFWPQLGPIDFNMMKRLRAVGMNMVFFDQMYETEVADAVGIDCHHAVAELFAALLARGCGKVLFLGYDGLSIPSEMQREEAFLALGGDPRNIYRVKWGGEVDTEVVQLLERLRDKGSLPAGIICCNGPIGLAAAKYYESAGIDHSPLGVIDFLPEMVRYPMVVYQQPMKEMALKIYERLLAQNNEGELWQPNRYMVKGLLIET